MHGVNLTMNDMQELRGVLGQIRDENGETRATLEFILKHLETLNGRTAKTEERCSVIENNVRETMSEARGAWKAITAGAAIIGAAASWAAKHLLPLLFVAALHAQQGIKPDQLRAAAPEGPRPTLLAYTLRGFQAVTLGTGITVTQTASGYTIDVAAAPAPKVTAVLVQTVLARASDGTYPATPNAVICRNGLRLRLGSDYTVAGGRIVPSAAWAADDEITADEWRVE